MPKPIIEKVQLNQMLREGKTLKQCGEFFNVSVSAISQAKKKLGISVGKEIALVEAHKVVSEHLDTVKQLQKINADANEILELLMRWNRGDDEALQVLESQITTKKVRVGNEEKFVKEFKFKDPRELALRAMQEIRGQLKLQNETLQALCEIRAVAEFQAELISLLKEIDQEIANEFIRRLEKRQSLRRAVKLL